MKDFNVPANPYGDEIEAVLTGEEELHARIVEMTHHANKKYKDADNDLILVAVLRGAVSFLTDFARQLSIPSQTELMAVSNYRDSTSSLGMVRILKDLDRDIEGHGVVIVEDIVDSGLTLFWSMKNLRSRDPCSPEVIMLLHKPEAVHASLDAVDVGFDIPNEFVIGYGLDYAECYRDLPYVGTLHPHAYRNQVCLRRLLHNTNVLRRALCVYPPAVLAGFWL